MFIDPLIETSIISVDHIKLLFSNVLQIKQIHEVFLDTLDDVILYWDEDTLIGDYFLKQLVCFMSLILLESSS